MEMMHSGSGIRVNNEKSVGCAYHHAPVGYVYDTLHCLYVKLLAFLVGSHLNKVSVKSSYPDVSIFVLLYAVHIVSGECSCRNSP